MAGSAIQLEVSDGDLAAVFAQLMGPQLDIAVRDVAEFGLNRIDDHFREERDAQGRPFQPLKRRTVRRKQRLGKILKILQQDGDLRRSIIYRIDSEGIIWGTNRIYAATQFLGDELRNIPARNPLDFSDADLQEMGELVRDRLTNRF